MKIHIIAIGGSVMHNLAIMLKNNGHIVTGSDDEINDPALSRLITNNLMPPTISWDEKKITPNLDIVVLGMHAKQDNPELLKAQTLNLKVVSYPEFIYELTKNKTRIVVGGSHGKTTITAMILHVMKHCNIEVDYLLGAQLEGYTQSVQITNTSKIAVLEGDEYLASPIDRRPKFHLYKPHIAIISGIAWDHINVFPTFENYLEQFKIFINTIEKNGSLIYYKNDEQLHSIVAQTIHLKINQIPYQVPINHIKEGITYINVNNTTLPLNIFGNHNLLNLTAAKEACIKIGITEAAFYAAISSFKGASKRLELVFKNNKFTFYKDFAHSPSKLKATINAVKQQFESKKTIACVELHTFSSLNETFLIEYKNTMNEADVAIVYFNYKAIEHKGLKPISKEMVIQFFNNQNLVVFTNTELLKTYITSQIKVNQVLLMMSSGNFNGIDFNSFAQELNNAI